jgi:TPR repeat protein
VRRPGAPNPTLVPCFQEARKLIQQAHENGLAIATVYYSFCLEEERAYWPRSQLWDSLCALPLDPANAVSLYHRAQCLLNGCGVKQDFKAGRALLLQAAEQGCVLSMYAHALEEEGREESYGLREGSRKWLDRAAEGGLTQAMLRLAKQQVWYRLCVQHETGLLIVHCSANARAI